MKTRLSALFAVALPIAVSAQALEKGGNPIFVNGFEAAASGGCAPAFPNGFVDTWMGIYGSAWPSFNAALIAYPPFDGSFSLAFSPSPNPNQYGTVLTYDFPGDGEGLAQLSISSTPGCFDPGRVQPNCISPVGVSPELDWSNSPVPGRCWLMPGQTYYVNLTFGGVPTDGMPGCPFGGCASELRNVLR